MEIWNRQKQIDPSIRKQCQEIFDKLFKSMFFKASENVKGHLKSLFLTPQQRNYANVIYDNETPTFVKLIRTN